MQNDSARIRLSCVLVFLNQIAVGAPVVSQVSGVIEHGSAITILGSGFGRKPIARPLVWDDTSGSRLLDKWDGAWPDNDPKYNTDYRPMQRGISLPHHHTTRYIAGAHGLDAGANGGYNVMIFKNVTISDQFPAYLYLSWYQRADDRWVFGGDNNFKVFDYSRCCTPYYSQGNWYLGYGPPNPSSVASGVQWGLNDAGIAVADQSLMNPDMNGHDNWWNPAVNPMSGHWSKVEIETKLTDKNDGFIRVSENSRVVLNYVGPTDKYPGKNRTIGIGVYARMTGQPNNWRYYADAYVDTSLARVVLADNADLSKATIIETQIPAKWSDDSVTATINLGEFVAGDRAYVFVFDPSGTHNSVGTLVIAGRASAPQSRVRQAGVLRERKLAP